MPGREGLIPDRFTQPPVLSLESTLPSCTKATERGQGALNSLQGNAKMERVFPFQRRAWGPSDAITGESGTQVAWDPC